jgi:photosystem II stability/assembly factor-like uncharacterized protein
MRQESYSKHTRALPARSSPLWRILGQFLAVALLLTPLLVAEGMSQPPAKEISRPPIADPMREPREADAVKGVMYPLEAAVQLGNAWQSQGPGFSTNGQTENIPGSNPVCGAIHTIAPHPTNADILYAGGVNAGVWRTTNATAGSPTWIPLTDQFPSLCIADIKFDPTDPSFRTLVAGTGRFSNFGGRGTDPAGILRTTDAGDHWTQLGQAQLAGRDIWAVAPRGNRILVATGAGLFRSTNQGADFTNISGSNGLSAGPVYDLASDPGDVQRIYAAVGGVNGGVFRSDDYGATWTDVTDAAIDAVVGGGTDNFEISVSAAAGNPVFIGVINGGNLAGVFRSPDQGATWTAMDLPRTPEGPTSAPIGIHPGGQGVSNFSIVADPTDGDIVYVGGDRQPTNVGPDGVEGGGDDSWPNSIGASDYSGRLFRGDAGVAPTGGVPSPQWTPLTHAGTASNSSPHADSRDMDFDASGVVLECDDGGIYLRTSPRSAAGDWFSRIGSGLQVGEFHDVAYDDNFNVVVGGTQDTGCPYQTSPGTTTWVELTTADGGDVAVDASVPGQSIFYWSNQYLGGFKRRTCTGANVCGAAVNIALNTVSGTPLKTSNPGRNTQFVTPIELNTQDPTRMIIGCTNSVYESFDQGDNLTELNSPGVNRSAMVYGHPDNADLIIVGSADRVYVRTTMGGNVSATATDPPLVDNVTDVAVDPADLNVMIAVDLTTVCITRDGGTSWEDITSNLSFVSGGNIRSVAYIEGFLNDILVVGAAQGAFACVEPFGSCWFELGTELPNTIVYDLDYDRADDRLVAGMLGRGTWTLNGVAALAAPVALTYPNGGETLLAGCQIEVTWVVGEGYEDETINILFSGDGGETWEYLLTNTLNDGSDVVNLPCVETTEGRIMLEVEGKTFCDISDEDFEVIFPSITIDADVDNDFDPANPWVQVGVIVDTFEFSADVDLFNIRFVADPLQDPDVPCEVSHLKKIDADMIEFVPGVIGRLEAGETAVVEIKMTVPIGQHAGEYTGQMHVVADHECECPAMVGDFDVTLEVLPQTDMDVADNEGNVSDNVLHLIGAKGDLLNGTFLVVNPNSTVLNVDPLDGPGNIRIDPVDLAASGLVKVGDPGIVIPNTNLTFDPLTSLASGEAQVVSLALQVPDDIPVNAVYVGTVDVTYESCLGGDQVSDQFTLQLEVLRTQGPLDILDDPLVAAFCPDDPWTMVGQVEFEFDIHAVGDHRNIRVSSGGLEHATLDKKLDDFNFFPEEIALLSAGETRTTRVIVKIPIGQHAGLYSGYFRVVSENGGEDSVSASIDICPLYDLDIKDHYANLGGNLMVIPAYSRANSSGGEWTLQAFDVGLPSELVNNHDEFDGPDNAPIDCITCEFGEWSTAWYEDDPAHDYHTNFIFTGEGSVDGEFCDWEQGEFKRMLVGVYVPRMQGDENHPGTYRGRLDCYAEVGGARVAQDYFEIEVQLAREVGPPNPVPMVETTFGGEPAPEGVRLYWGDFSSLGMTGEVNLYRKESDTGGFVCIQSALPQGASYVDAEIDPRSLSVYRLGILHEGKEQYIGPLVVGGKPMFFMLGQNYPNPVRDNTIISYNLPGNGNVSIKVFDLAGRLVRTLKDDFELAGYHSMTWDRRDGSGRSVASGVYFYRLVTPKFESTKKMLVIE